MADILLLGSPYVRGKVAAPGKSMYRYRQDAPITIGDTYSGKALRWVEANGLLVAQGEVLTRVSRKMLAVSGLDQDCTLTIDGDEYKYRLLCVAPGKSGEPCEWEALQQAYPGVWMFDDNEIGIWGQEGVYLNKKAALGAHFCNNCRSLNLVGALFWNASSWCHRIWLENACWSLQGWALYKGS